MVEDVQLPLNSRRFFNRRRLSFGTGVVSLVQVVQATMHATHMPFGIAFTGPILDSGALGTASAAGFPIKVFNLEVS